MGSTTMWRSGRWLLSSWTRSQISGLFDDQLTYLTDVGEYTTATSHYGLFDVDGNARQWTDTSKVNPFDANQELPIARGGSWVHGFDGNGTSYRPAQFFAAGSVSLSGPALGIRIAQLVPGDYDGWRCGWR